MLCFCLLTWLSVLILLHAALALPQSCTEVQNHTGTQADGEYCLDLGGHLAVIYCDGMSGSDPKEYLTLRAGSEENYSKKDYPRFSTYEGAAFDKVRLDIATMNVTKDDYTFATTTTADGPQPYGVSEYCGYHDGANYYEWSEFNINLTGTGFRIQDSVVFGKFGGYFNPGIGKHYFLTESADGSAVRCDVAGECGGCGPNIQNNQPGDLTLRLMGFPPRIVSRKLECLRACLATPDCSSVYHNSLTGECYPLEEDVFCVDTALEHEKFYRKETDQQTAKTLQGLFALVE